MADSILVSKDNAVSILTALFSDLKTKITNKDISLPYTTEFTKGSYIKIDGDGSMYLSNNGTYIKIGTIVQDQLDISKIYQIFSIRYNLIKTWNVTQPTTPATIDHADAVAYNGKIYYIGGSTNGTSGGSNNITRIYDTSTGTWSTGANMPTARFRHTSTLYNGKIYCISGMNSSGSIIPYTEIYDIASNTWSTGANIPSSRWSGSAQVYKGKIYVAGGWNGSGNINDLYIYDIASNTWSGAAAMPSAKQAFKSALISDKIYCIGGWTSGPTNTNYIYNITTNSWTTGAGMPISWTDGILCAYDTYIYCIGGWTGSINNTTAYVYNTTNGTWSTDSVTSPYLGSWPFVFYNNNLYCFGDTLKILNFSFYSYNTPLPSSLSTKLSKLTTTGTGTKVFSNDGTYKSITPSYTVMTSDEITQSLNSITSV